jgi:predicted acylesterase/phospholipase RssA
MIDTICLSGGGVKGISYISALSFLEKENYIDFNNILNLVGTSSGSIICFFLSIGYTLKELEDFVLQFDFKKLEPDVNCNIFLSEYGIDDGIKIMTTIKTFLIEKLDRDDITFKELYELKNKNLQIFTTNFTLARSEIFSYKTTPDVSILLAIRMSICVPFLFTPVQYNNCYYVDGGITYNFGLNYCNNSSTIGLAITNKKINDLDSFHSYFTGLCSIALDSISLNSIYQEEKYFKYNYIEINCQLKEGLEFGITTDCVQQLLNEGKDFSEKYYRNFISKIVIDDIIDKIICID